MSIVYGTEINYLYQMNVAIFTYANYNRYLQPRAEAYSVRCSIKREY